tara:strand:+ start:109 stop:264 length:156 start_codon:yes stop_codon:yes gene_type:complete
MMYKTSKKSRKYSTEHSNSTATAQQQCDSDKQFLIFNLSTGMVHGTLKLVV